MEIKIKTLEDSITVRENGGMMEVTMKQKGDTYNDFCVMFLNKKDAKRIGKKLLDWASKKD